MIVMKHWKRFSRLLTVLAVTVPLVVSLVVPTGLSAEVEVASSATKYSLMGYRANVGGGGEGKLDTGWVKGNLGNTWDEGDWVPYKLVISHVQTGYPGLDEFPDVELSYDFRDTARDPQTNELTDHIFVDLIRWVQVGTTIDSLDDPLDDEHGWPNALEDYTLDNPPYYKKAHIDQVQGSDNGGPQSWPDFVPLFSGGDGSDRVNLRQLDDGILEQDVPPGADRHFLLITAEDLDDLEIDTGADTIVIYFQAHLAETRVWQDADELRPYASEWGGSLYQDAEAWIPKNGSGAYPGASPHMSLESDGKQDVPIPVPPTTTGEPCGEPSVVVTNAASAVTTNSATLNGTLNDLGTASSADVSFEWATDAFYTANGNTYENETTAAGSMSATGTFNEPLVSLIPGTTYHFMARAVGDCAAYGSDMTFTTDVTLTVNTVGSGSVSKLPDQATYTYGTPVQLTATADPGWTFSAWSGDLTGSLNPDNLTMDGDKTATATFTQDQYTLTVNTVGSGSVTKLPDQATYADGTNVQLTATADPGWTFSAWSGDLTGSLNPDNVTMDGDKTVTATFTQDQYILTVNTVGNGSVAKSPGRATYADGTNVQLTASSAAGWTFSAWSGDLTGSLNPDNITMDGDKTVTATFTQGQYTLTVNTVGSGSVSKLPDQPTYAYGTPVQLTATADPDWTFSTWSGDLTGSLNPDNLTMDGDKTVTATFEKRFPDLVVSSLSGGWVEKNSTYTVTFTVCNIGTVEAGASVAAIYIDGVDGIHAHIGPLGAGECSDSITLGPFPMSEGSDEIEVRADDEGAVEESNEENNNKQDLFVSGGCFIATAALGPDDSSVETLRSFRDSHLASNSIGSGFVSAYYKLSPPLAEFIDGHPALKPVVRAGLLPAVGASTLAVGTSMAFKVALASSMAMASIAAALWARRRSRAAGIR